MDRLLWMSIVVLTFAALSSMGLAQNHPVKPKYNVNHAAEAVFRKGAGAPLAIEDGPDRFVNNGTQEADLISLLKASCDQIPSSGEVNFKISDSPNAPKILSACQNTFKGVHTLDQAERKFRNFLTSLNKICITSSGDYGINSRGLKACQYYNLLLGYSEGFSAAVNSRQILCPHGALYNTSAHKAAQ